MVFLVRGESMQRSKSVLVTAFIMVFACAGGFFLGTPSAHAGKNADKVLSYLNGDDAPIKTEIKNGRYKAKDRVQKFSSRDTNDDRTATSHEKSRKHQKKQRKGPIIKNPARMFRRKP